MIGIGTELLGVIAVGIGAAALIFALRHLLSKLGVRVPSWALPVGIGLSMIVYSVWNDYAWHGRAVARLPEGAQVLQVGRDSQAWAPWTYLWPVAVRMAAIDPAQISQSDTGIRTAQIMLVDRRTPTLLVPQDFDCQNRLIRPANRDWVAAAADDPALEFVCASVAGQ